ncbi:HPr kinase/phosphatase C-terminal domain-containing protein [Hyphomicrobiales bacterium 4NK60-0047b]|jgi:serine kinase of HPr protein (carbohydrate metabolism regulator)
MTIHKTIQHGTLININGKGVLLLGPSAAGKSDLALRLIMPPSPFVSEKNSAHLVADDQVEIIGETAKHQKTLYGQAPKALKGLLEVRHLGIKTFDYLEKSPIDFVIKLKKHYEIERLPDEGNEIEIIEGHVVPLFFLDPFEASVLNKLNLILSN